MLIFAGSWTDKGQCDQRMAEFVQNLSGKIVALFGTAGFGGTPEYFVSLAERFAKYVPENRETIGSFYCPGKMLLALKSR